MRGAVRDAFAATMTAEMNYFEVTFEPTPEFAVRVYWEMLWKQYAAYVICSVLIAIVAWWRLLIRSEIELWAFSLGVAATFWYGWWDGGRRARAAVASRSPLTVHFAANQVGCTFRTDSSSQWFSWAEVLTVHRLKSALILQRRNGMNAIPIPISALDDSHINVVVDLARGPGK